ncbi:MAG: ribosome-associated translation inhibitor RaiA [Chloroflexota bacterium]
MEPVITSKGMELSPAVEAYIRRKLNKVNRQLNGIQGFDVVVSEEKTRAATQRARAQLTVNHYGTILRAEERGEDVTTAIDRVEKVIMRRIEHYKGKLYKKGRGNSTVRAGFDESLAVEPEPRVVKVKRFDVKPMPVSEAIEQMELLGHDFFLFLNAETSLFNLVYRRRDGNYGLIETESRQS